MRALMVLLLILLTGCTTSSFLGDPIEPYQDVLDGAPPQLVTFNESLEQGAFTVVLTDSAHIRHVEYVVIGPETTRYRQRGLVSKYLPTKQVARIEARRAGGSRAGVSLGIAPGLALLALGAGAVLRPEENNTVLVGPILLGMGFVGLAGGSAVGGIAGEVVSPSRRRNVYLAERDVHLFAPPD